MLKLSALGMSLKRIGFAFDVRLEKSDGTIRYFVKNEKLSFESLIKCLKHTESICHTESLSEVSQIVL